MGTILTRVRREIVELNLFNSGLNDVAVVRQQRWSTRVYLILMVIALMILIIYTALGIETVHIVVNDPSLKTYETLQLKYPATLKCPCSQIAVKYGSFLQIQPVYHQVEYSQDESKTLNIIIDMFQCICNTGMDFGFLWNKCVQDLAHGCSYCNQCSRSTSSFFLC